MELKWVNVPLWDTEIIPAEKSIKKMHLFTNPVGMTFQYDANRVKSLKESNQIMASALGCPNVFKLKDFAIGFHVAEVGPDVSDKILEGTMLFIMGMNKVVQAAPLKSVNLIYYTDELCLKNTNEFCLKNTNEFCLKNTNGIIREIQSQECYRVEIEWDKGLYLTKPISLSVFLLGEYGCCQADWPQLFCECSRCREQYDKETAGNTI